VCGQDQLPLGAASASTRPFVDLAYVHLDDVTAALLRAAEMPRRAGFRVLNLVGPDASCRQPVVDVLRASLGRRLRDLDLTAYEALGNEHAPIYALDALKAELGFIPAQCTARHLR
jgi:nucleoside-diphosphate-sugar epimerase